MTYHDVVIKKWISKTVTHRIASVISVLMLPVLLTACGPQGLVGGGGHAADTSGNGGNSSKVVFSASSTMGHIRDRGHLIVGLRWNEAPFSFQDPSTGSASGFDVSMVDQIASAIFGTQSIEGKITWVPLDPRDNELALEQNKVDIVVGRYSITVAKKTFVDFAGPYFSDPQSIVINTNLEQNGYEINSIGDLNGYKVCVVTGSSDVTSFKALAPNADVSDVRATMAQCGADLQAGSVVAIVASHVDEINIVNSYSNFHMLSSNADFAPVIYGIGVKKGTDDLRSFLNDQISSMDWGKYYGQWLPNDPSGLSQPPIDRY